jgi:hypothetical protein
LFKGLNKNTFSGCGGGGGGVVIFGIKTASFLNPGDLAATLQVGDESDVDMI